MTLAPAVAAAFDTQLAELTAAGRVVTVPVAPLYWGSDLSCVTDCDASFSELPGDNSALIVAQSSARRLITPRGAVLDDPDYGLDLRAYCNRGVTTQDLRALQTRCVAELVKDERVADVEVDVTYAQSALRVQARITPADPSLAPFRFVFAVDTAAALLELI